MWDFLLSYQVLGWFDVGLKTAWGLVNTPFMAAAIAGGLAAYWGARGAQLSDARDKKKEALLKEIRNTNACLSVAFTMVNALLGLKAQHVLPMKRRFDTLKTSLQEYLRRRRAGELPGTEFLLPADFQTMEPLRLPIERLEHLAFEKVSLPARPLTVLPMLSGAIASLYRTIIERNGLIAEHRERGPVPSSSC